MKGRTFSLFLYILLYLFCVAVGVLSAQTEQHSYVVGSICQETVTANKDMVDEYSTEALREEAKQKVQPVYQLDDTILNQSEENIYSDFSKLEQIRQRTKQIHAAQDPSVIKSIAETDWTGCSRPLWKRFAA